MLLANILSLQFFEFCIKNPYEQTVYKSGLFLKTNIILSNVGLF